MRYKVIIFIPGEDGLRFPMITVPRSFSLHSWPEKDQIAKSGAISMENGLISSGSFEVAHNGLFEFSELVILIYRTCTRHTTPKIIRIKFIEISNEKTTERLVLPHVMSLDDLSFFCHGAIAIFVNQSRTENGNNRFRYVSH